MFYVYIIKSKKDDNLYIGYTDNLVRRIKEHNSGLVASTKSRSPFYPVYCEIYASKAEALKREHNLKLRSKAWAQLCLRIKESLKT
ncbi:MAG: GIY-YIG nuclease family protein [bacterium]|nr:GIY-YIG nuclease family protein [bacterium]